MMMMYTNQYRLGHIYNIIIFYIIICMILVVFGHETLVTVI